MCESEQSVQSANGFTEEEAGRGFSFIKMSGAGNDFVLVDNREAVLGEAEKAGLARWVCRRRVGVGADGLILIEPPGGLGAAGGAGEPGGGEAGGADYAMRYFNADGSEGELCGNGTRCAAVFARRIGAAPARQRIATPAGVLRAEVVTPDSGSSATVRVELAPPGSVRRVRLAGLPGGDGEGGRDGDCEVFALEVGVPHAVEIVADLDAVDVPRRGGAIRRHPAFLAGANANFIALDQRAGEIRLRTFERGVEAETLACGTGAVAAATVAHRHFGWPPTVRVRVTSGDLLRIELTPEAVRMEGPATRIYEAVLSLPPPGRRIHPASSASANHFQTDRRV